MTIFICFKNEDGDSVRVKTYEQDAGKLINALVEQGWTIETLKTGPD